MENVNTEYWFWVLLYLHRPSSLCICVWVNLEFMFVFCDYGVLGASICLTRNAIYIALSFWQVTTRDAVSIAQKSQWPNSIPKWIKCIFGSNVCNWIYAWHWDIYNFMSYIHNEKRIGCHVDLGSELNSLLKTVMFNLYIVCSRFRLKGSFWIYQLLV